MIRASKLVIFIATVFTMTTVSFANPTGANIPANGGSITFGGTPKNMIINQTSQRGIINWQKFNIKQNESTSFIQPQGGSTLNRVITNNPAKIFGRLNATGQIILVAPGGVFFGPKAKVNVGSIIASTTGISDDNYLNPKTPGQLIFDMPSASNSSVVNKGTIIAKDNGLVALIGSRVSNEGYISANLGSVVLASGNKFTVDMKGNGLVNFVIDEGSSNTSTKPAVNNSGTIMADGGTILMTAKSAQGVLDHAINMTGIAQAQSVDEHNGEIIFSAGPTGKAYVSGTVSVAGKNKNSKGGSIKILGDNIQIASSAKIDASGDLGGGTILIGGNLRGKGPEQNASNTTVDSGAKLLANSVTGNGGNIIVWSDVNTQFHGMISATSEMGQGGFAETSGHHLNIKGASVNLTSANGETGTWLLDPADLTICSLCSTDAIFSGSTFSTNGTNSFLLVSDLTDALALANIIVQTTNDGTGGFGDINVDTPISWSSNNSLTLSAYRSINIGVSTNGNITNTGTGNLILQADNSGTGVGTVNFAHASLIDLSGGGTISLYYNPTSYTNFITDYGNFAANVTAGTLNTYMLVNTLGNPTDPNTTTSLGAISNNASLWGYNYALGRDIDASDTSGWNSGEGFKSIGVTGTPFSGLFDGQNHVISNLTINLPNTTPSENYGFFGNTSGSAVIQNLGLTDASIIIDSPSANIQIGGLVGYNLGTIINSYTSGNLIANANTLRAGGLVGRTESSSGAGNIFNSHSNMNISSSANGLFQTAGGLIGSAFNSAGISQSYSTGTVNVSGSSQYNYTGGLIGELQSGNINQSYTHSAVNTSLTGSITSISGGLIGMLLDAGGSVTNSYAITAIKENSNTTSDIQSGGLVGSNFGTVSNSYSAGLVDTTASSTPVLYQGGLVGRDNAGTVTDSYWDTQTTGQSTSAGGTGLTTAQLQSGLQTGFGVPGTTWNIISSISYPYLQYFQPSTPRVISGTVTGVASGTVIQLAENGTDLVNSGQTIGQTSTGANGYYYFLETNGVITDNSPLLIYAPNSAANAVTIAPMGGNSVLGLDTSLNAVSIGDNSLQTLSNSVLASAHGSLASPGILYSSANNAGNIDLTLISNADFNVNHSNTYQLDGSIYSAGSFNLKTPQITAPNTPVTLGFSGTISGDFSNLNNLILAPAVGVNFTLPTSFNSNITITGNGGSVFSGSGSNNTFNLGGTIFTFNDSTGSNSIYTLQSGLTILGTLLGANNSSIDASSTTGNTWNILGVNQGSTSPLGDVSIQNFTNISNIAGGTGDTFSFTNGGFSGTISAVSDGTLSYVGYNAPVTVNLASNSADNLNGGAAGGFSGFTQFDGPGGTLGTLVGPDTTPAMGVPNSWNITSNDSGNINSAITFNNFGNLASGFTSDHFILSDNVGLSGSLTFNNNLSTLDYSQYTTTPVQILLNFDGFTNPGLATNINGDIFGYFGGLTMIGSAAHPETSRLEIGTSGDASNDITFTGPTSGEIGGSFMPFSNFGQVVANSGRTTVTMTDGFAFAGELSVTGGVGVLDYSGFTLSDVLINLLTNTATNVNGTFSGFTEFVGSNTTQNTISYNADDLVWTVNFANEGSLNDGIANYTFSQFDTLQGGFNNTFVMNNGGSLTGDIVALDGILDYTNFGNAINANLTAGTIDGLTGTFTGISNVMGSNGFASMNHITSTTGNQTWFVNGADNGLVNGVTFSEFGNLNTGTNDIVTFQNGSSLSGALTSTGNGRLNYASYNAPVAIDLATNTVANITGGFNGGFTNFTGSDFPFGSSTSTLTGTNTASVWTITSTNTGTIDTNGVTFEGFGNLNGGTGGDTFIFADGSSLTGALTAPTSTIDFTGFSPGDLITVNLETNTSNKILGGFTGVVDFRGSDGTTGLSSTLIGTNTASMWNFATTDNAGTVGGVQFSGFGNFTGGTGGDTFTFGAGIGVSGSLNATNGTLDDSGYGSPVTLTLSSPNQTITNVGGTISGFTTIIAPATSNLNSVLDTSDNDLTWNITGADAGSVNASAGNVAFTNFGQIFGGNRDTYQFANGSSLSGSIVTPSDGTFILDNATVAGSLNAGGNGTFVLQNGASVTGSLIGGETLDYSSYGGIVSVNLATDTAVGVGGTISGITNFIGSTGFNNTIQGENSSSNLWAVTSSNSGNINSNAVTFTGFRNLIGGNSGDTFNIAASINGIAGGTSANTYNLLNGANVANLNGGSSGNNTLIALNSSPNSWTMVGGFNSISGGVSVASFSQIANLEGSNGGDTFLTNGTFNSITGGTGSNTYQLISGANIANLQGGTSANSNSIEYLGGTANTWTANGTSGTVTGDVNIGTYNNVGNLTAGGGNDTFNVSGALNNISGGGGVNNLTTTNASGSNAWNITGSNSGDISGTTTINSFSNFENLTGGGGDDNFAFHPGAQVANIDGNSGGVNTLDYTNYGSASVINLETATASGMTGSFSNINKVIGSSTLGGILTARNTSNVWNVNGTNTGTLTGLDNGFSQITSIVGGSVDDIFTISAPITSVSGGGGSNSFTINAGANIQTLTGGTSSSPNTFFLKGGTIDTLNGGPGTDNLLSTNTTTNPISLNLDNTSGSISGGANVRSFTNIGNFTSSNDGDTLNINTALASITTGANSTINIGSSANIGTLNGGAGSTFILNQGANIGLLNGNNGSVVANSGAPITWNINGSSGTATGGINLAYNLINSVTGGSGGDIFNLSGNVNSVIGGGGANKFVIADGARVNSLNGGSSFQPNEIDTQAYSQTLDITLKSKQGANWGGIVQAGDDTVINFTNMQIATGRSGAGGKFNVDPALFISNPGLKVIVDSPTSGHIPDPFFFYNFSYTGGQNTNPYTTHVLSYANQLNLFSVSPEASQFNFLMSNLFDLEALQQQLDLEMKNETEFGCMAP